MNFITMSKRLRRRVEQVLRYLEIMGEANAKGTNSGDIGLLRDLELSVKHVVRWRNFQT